MATQQRVDPRPTRPGSEGVAHLRGDVEHGVERVTVEAEHLGRRNRAHLHRRQTRPIVEQGHLAEDAADADPIESDDFVADLLGHFELARRHDVERVRSGALEHGDLPPAEFHRLEQSGDQRTQSIGQQSDECDTLEDRQLSGAQRAIAAPMSPSDIRSTVVCPHRCHPTIAGRPQPSAAPLTPRHKPRGQSSTVRIGTPVRGRGREPSDAPDHLRPLLPWRNRQVEQQCERRRPTRRRRQAGRDRRHRRPVSGHPCPVRHRHRWRGAGAQRLSVRRVPDLGGGA